MRTKFAVILPVGLAAAAVSSALAPTYRLEAAAMAVAAAGYGLTVAWYFIGTGSPRGLLLLDVVPKVAGGVMGSLSLILGSPLIVLPLSILFCVLCGPAIGALLVRRTCARMEEPFESIIRSLRAQGHAVTARGFSALYTALPVTLVAAVAPSLVPAFAAIERLLRMVLLVLQTLPNALQAWLGSAPDDSTRHERARRVIVWNAALGLAAGCGFAFVAPMAGAVLFGEAVPIDALGCGVAGLVILLTCTSRATGSLGLVSVSRVDTIAASAASAAVAGVILIPAFAMLGGVPGAFAGEAIAEVVNLVIQYVVLRRFVPGLL
ncbi:hypothetical protein ACN27E_12910 [Mycobacterium sp. WMMD1722]|uniref:hypothetical protein n=1 Tax=Mycobacterium sp. WMMD1722 TaxID=3404117 RepID=UPI003BF4C348